MRRWRVVTGLLIVLALSGCGPAVTRQPKADPLETQSPTPVVIATTPPAPTTIVTYSGVHSGAFCSEHGALGTTATGVAMRCMTSTTDSSYRWRKV